MLSWCLITSTRFYQFLNLFLFSNVWKGLFLVLGAGDGEIFFSVWGSVNSPATAGYNVDFHCCCCYCVENLIIQTLSSRAWMLKAERKDQDLTTPHWLFFSNPRWTTKDDIIPPVLQALSHMPLAVVHNEVKATLELIFRASLISCSDLITSVGLTCPALLL